MGKIKNKIMTITRKANDTRLGEEVIRISLGGNERVGWYLVYRGNRKTVKELLKIGVTAMGLLTEDLEISSEETVN